MKKKFKITNKVRYFFTKKVIIILQYYLAGASVKASLIYSHKKKSSQRCNSQDIANKNV